MSTTKLEHRIALATFARNQASEGSWAYTFWNQVVLELRRKR